MNILVIGSCHCYGYGVAAEHLGTNLFSYDLILLQIGHFELLNADKFKK